MSSSVAISLPSCTELDRFCSTNNVSEAAIIKLAFAVVLHQYFDLADFTYSEAAPQSNDDLTPISIAGTRQVQYISELASTTSLRGALGLSDADSPTSDSLALLLIEHQAAAVTNGAQSASRPTARLVSAQTADIPVDSLFSSLVAHQNDVCLAVFSDKGSLLAQLLYNVSEVSEFVATGFVDAFAAAIQSIFSVPLETVVADLDICGAHSRATISKWNQHSTSTPNKLLHELVGQGFRHKPDAIAILSWDGEMSYSELDKRSSTLAAYLMETYDLKPGRKVALCFEKCTWAVVSMLAVLKAGAAYCCLDPSHPRARHDFIIDALDAPLVLTSTLYESHLDGQRLLVPTLELVSQQRPYQATDVQPSDTCIVAFTSGSTGNPKGIVHTHNSLITGILSNAPPQCLAKEGVSTYQWSSFTFDVSMTEIYAPLIYGGRICIPSDEERLNNVEESMNRMAVNWAYFTPSFARFFAPYNVPSLQTLLMGGEVVTSDDINAWIDRVKVIHSYGPAESATFFLADFSGPCPKTVPIGHAPNTYAWIVNPENPELLSPLGGIGEMLYEGPGLLKEYLGDPKKSKESLIDAPSWRRNLDAPTASSKLYKSGDLVRYLPDGTMMYIGRKDTMAKMRGQRLEVEEVESVIRKSLGGTNQVAVDVITPSRENRDAVLVAFLCLKEDGTAATMDLAEVKSHLQAQLKKALPEYMIPQVFLSMDSFPYNASRKLDRKALRQYGSSLTLEELLQPSVPRLSEQSLPSGAQLVPSPVNGNLTEALKTNGFSQQLEERSPGVGQEKSSSLLRGPWSQVLSIKANEVAEDDNFFQHGGNSLKAMALVALARSSGLSITVAKVFQNPTFAALALSGTLLSYVKQEPILPFSLLDDDDKKFSVLSDAAIQCKVDPDAGIIQDILPATPLQAGFITGSQEKTGAYMAQYSLKIPPQTSPEFFKDVWDRIIQEYSILRTRLIYSNLHGVFQVILSTKPIWRWVENQAEYLENDRIEGMGYGDPLCRLAIVRSSNTTETASSMIITIHHALYDRHTLDKLLSAANSLMQGRTLTLGAPYAPFIKFIMTRDLSVQQQYWEKQFDGVSAVKFPWLPSTKHVPKADSTFQINVEVRPSRSAAITKATIIRAAWALLVSHYTGSDDVVHGLTLSGRGAPVPSILDIVEPTITTVPVRINVSREQRIVEWLRKLQKESSDMIEYEQTGLSKIKSYGEACRDACNFHNLLVIQTPDEIRTGKDELYFDEVTSDFEYFNEYALMIIFTMQSSASNVLFSFDSQVVEKEQVTRFAHHLEYLIDAISAASDDKTIGDIYPASLRDIVDVVAWSGRAPESAPILLHDLIADGFTISPRKKAIESWDGDMTFEELQEKSSQLAHRLKAVGAGRDVVVGLLFEKSLWAIVSVLAVLKSGSAFLFVDPAHPVRRQQSILQTADVRTVLASPRYIDHFEQFELSHALVVDGSLLATLPQSSQTEEYCDASPSDLAYLLTTSGTTGEPKVILHTHASVSSGLRNHSKSMGISSSTRAIQVSTYTFDLAIYEIFGTLMTGGCVCVPQDDERLNDLAACIRHYEANWALLTASYARLLREQRIPTLRTLNLCGEYVPLEDEEYWASRLDAMNWYGASENEGFTMGNLSNGSQRPGETGRASGSAFWIVDRHTKELLPVGARGEIALSGPGLARGYAKDSVKTARAFCPAPEWLSTAYGDRRIYMTGDKGQINSNGTLTVLGRFDTQIKLNGKRIEVEEIEASIKSALPTTGDVAVDLVELPNSGPSLVAFLKYSESEEFHGQTNGEASIVLESYYSSGEKASTLITKIRSHLLETLPGYMIPRIYIPLATLPITSNGKLDRTKLKEKAKSLSTDELFQYTESSSGGNTLAPPSALASLLRGPWSQVLSVDPDTIANDDNFFQNGGDSLKAIGLVMAARGSGLFITVGDVLQNPTFAALASSATPLSDIEE